ncbi:MULTISPECIES: hypothetical protein [Streptomyces]|uniref:Uncharacterized protein n=1 Tax=Streptomyces nymphaeiformis TaxID=2663842 RepID=A0A7W7X8R8_9ACTN|nr:hypothetical protein [Streptomyces nymphaeiformis]MBB4979624.1 hypothetical protein [Streptomyces nymphaeiformis]
MTTSIGARRRRRGRLAAVAGAAVLATGMGTAVAASVNTAPVPAAPAVASSGAASVAGSVRVVAPGERIAAGADELWLTAEGLHVGATAPEVLRVAGVLPGKVATIARGDASGALFAGIYRGPVTATTTVTLTVGGRTLQAKVVALAGKPGWAAYYVFDAKAKASMKPSITVRT